ncbi:MAG: hypothetical protein ALAOOOJD_01289 [bacterium]|nr:hypothetical protein [bacterium]
MKNRFGANQMIQAGAGEAPNDGAAAEYAHGHEAGAGAACRIRNFAARVVGFLHFARAHQHVDDANHADNETGEQARDDGVHRCGSK